MLRIEIARPDGIEAIAICTPNHTHFEIARAFLEAGLDVIVDKPMTFSVADAEELVQLQEKTGRVVAATYSFAHHAMVRQATEMVAAGMLGRIRQAHVGHVA